MWQSHVEIEGYSVMYFDHIAALQALYHWTSIKSEAHTCFVNLLAIYTSMKHIWAPPLMKARRYDALNTVMWSKYKIAAE